MPDANNYNLIMAIKPAVRIDSFKIGFVMKDTISKIDFLGKINEIHDNSSELAGFEINKLLHEQSKLEKNYADLIKDRSQLKGISNKEKHQEVERQIADVSKCLRENTKKLCRLFKENTNLDNDSSKVRGEREELNMKLRVLDSSIERNAVDQFIELLNRELLEQNKLGDYLRIEKELTSKIKELKNKIGEETKEFEDLRKEKKNTIHQLKEEVAKAHTQSAAKLRYEDKVSQTKVDTARRINAMKMKQIQKESEEVRELQKREQDVTSKLESFLKDENVRIDDNLKELAKSYEEKKKIIREDRIKFEVDIKRENDLIEHLTKEIETERRLQAEEDERIKRLVQAKADEDEKQRKIDEKMMIIQQQFEEWMRLVGPKRKKGGAANKK